MARYMFTAGTRFMFNDNEYMVRKVIDLGIEVENLEYKKIEHWRREELLDKWSTGALMFRLSPKGEELLKVETLDDLEPNEKKIAMYRFKVLKPVLEYEIQTTEALFSYLEEQNPKVSKSTFYNWMKKWNHTEDIRTLIDSKRGPKGPFINKKVLDIIDEVLEEYEYRGEKFVTEHIYSEVNLRIEEDNKFRKGDKLKPVSRSTVHRRRKQRLDKYRKDKEKQGTVQANLNRDGVKQEVVVGRPLERVEIDWTRLDVMLIDPTDLKPKRPWFVYAIDRCTGYPLGFVVTFKPIDAGILKQLLLHIIMPKTYIEKLYPLVKNKWLAYGIPSCIVVDNASVNDSYEFEDACYQLGVKDVQFCTVGAGHQKSSIERGFRTLNTYLVHSLKGTTFSNIFEKGMYDSEGKACITIEVFIYMAHLVMVDLIANSYSSRRGNTPNELWGKGICENQHLSLMIPRSVKDLKLLLMEGSVIRTIQPQGVQVENEYYYSSELITLKNELEKENFSKEVRVRFDTSDMREVYVYDRRNNKYIVARQTGMLRKEIDIERPVTYIRLEMISKTYNKNKNKVDQTLRAEVRRSVEQLEVESKKEVSNYRKNLDQERKETPDYIGMALGAEDFIIPENEEIKVSPSGSLSTEKKKRKLNNKNKGKEKDNLEYLQTKEFIIYPEVDELPTYNVNYKKE